MESIMGPFILRSFALTSFMGAVTPVNISTMCSELPWMVSLGSLVWPFSTVQAPFSTVRVHCEGSAP